MKTPILIAAYLFAIVAANLSIATFGAAASIVNAFVFIAFDLAARDHLHDAWRGSRWRMAVLIATGGLLSYTLNANAGTIALASVAAFVVSGLGDTLVYQQLIRRPYLVRANGSNVVGAAIDSILFPLLAFGWPPLWWVMAGQFAAKTLGGALWAAILGRWRA